MKTYDLKYPVESNINVHIFDKSGNISFGYFAPFPQVRFIYSK